MDTEGRLPYQQLFKLATQWLECLLLGQTLLVWGFWLFYFLSMLCNWWINIFKFFKKPGFYRFWDDYVSLFHSCKQSLDNFGAGLYPCCCNLDWPLSIEIVLYDFDVYFRAQTGWVLIGGRCVCVYFITHCHSEFAMVMNCANPFICCYYFNVVALSKYLALSNISSVVFGNALDVMVFASLRTKFANDLWWRTNFKAATLYLNGFAVEECLITNFAEGKNWIHFQTFLIVLFLN